MKLQKIWKQDDALMGRAYNGKVICKFIPGIKKNYYSYYRQFRSEHRHMYVKNAIKLLKESNLVLSLE